MTSPDIARPAATAPDAASGRAGALSALVGGALAMGISPVFVRLAQDAGVGPFASAFWRVALALPVLYAWARLEERAAGAGAKPTFTRPAVVSGLLFAGDLLFWHVSILQTTIANATFFATTAPIWVVLFSWAVLKQRIRREILAGVALCLLGGVALIGHSLQVDPAKLRGDLFGLATAVFFGLYFIAVQAARAHAGAARVTFALSCVTALILLGVALLAGDALWPRTAAGALALLGMSWLSHAGGQGLLSVALGRLPAVFSSLVIFLEAIAAAIVAWIALGEALTVAQSLGGALILLGIWIARPREAAKP
ncbi:EamA/RhaT family transporter [Alsobacter soli]|uniref:EamA/RhaT family transporter n=1 Tax=Alsobacter soli TaxID=2109933 RepID=A0A2T1HZ99_9HYPH|nr:DMT family transporter [Alsobacter soli]PSC07023.1 EamA/RhaT family transporter [Alsobacter soli]